jgi:hypothetical protein
VPGPDGPPTHVIRHRERPAVVVDLDVAALTRLARRRGVRLSLVPAFGEFTRADGVVFEVRGAGRVPARRVRGLVAFAEEHAISGRHRPRCCACWWTSR